MNACQMDRESHLQDDVRSVQILQRMQCTNECNEHDAHDAKTNGAQRTNWYTTIENDCNDCNSKRLTAYFMDLRSLLRFKKSL